MIGLAALLTIGGGGCRERAVEEEGGAEDELTPMTFAVDDEVALEYADLGGRFRRATRVAAVPMASRRVVRVIEPTAGTANRQEDRLVHIVDASRVPASGELTTRLAPREEFERRALAALPPGAASRVQIPGAGPGLSGPAEWSHDQIILYGTTWCGACKQAREFFRERELEFVERNVEHDPESAAELAVKAAAVGIAPDRVPVIDVRGRVIVGFDQARLETLLGESL